MLVNGAAGGVGSFAVQITKAFGAHVTGVCSTSKIDLVRSIGADEVIDYTLEDIAQGARRYDVIFDTAGNREVSDLRRILVPATCRTRSVSWGRDTGAARSSSLCEVPTM